MYVSRPKQYTEPSIYHSPLTPSVICLGGLPRQQDPARPVPLQETAPQVDRSSMMVGVVNCLLVQLLRIMVNQIILHYKLLKCHSLVSSQSICTSPRSSPLYGRCDKNSNPPTVIVKFDARVDEDETSQALCDRGVGNLSEDSGRTSGGMVADVGSGGILTSSRKVVGWRALLKSGLIELEEPPIEIHMVEGVDFDNVVKFAWHMQADSVALTIEKWIQGQFG